MRMKPVKGMSAEWAAVEGGIESGVGVTVSRAERDVGARGGAVPVISSTGLQYAHHLFFA
jgi:hypothetical protein